MIDFEGNSSVPYFTIGGNKFWCVKFYRETNFAAAYNLLITFVGMLELSVFNFFKMLSMASQNGLLNVDEIPLRLENILFQLIAIEV